jgi:hypothetical protein
MIVSSTAGSKTCDGGRLVAGNGEEGGVGGREGEEVGGREGEEVGGREEVGREEEVGGREGE